MMKSPERIHSPQSQPGVFSIFGGLGEIVRQYIQQCPLGFHSDDDFSFRVHLLQIADGLGDLAQRVGFVDVRCELSGFEEFLQESHKSKRGRWFQNDLSIHSERSNSVAPSLHS